MDELPTPSVLTLAAWYDICDMLTFAGFSPGSAGPSCAVMSERAAAVAAACADAALASPSSAGATAALSAPSMFSAPSPVTTRSLLVASMSPATRFTPEDLAAAVASHGSPSTAEAVPASVA